MPPKLNPGSDRVEACWIAANKLVEKHGSGNAAAKAERIEQGTLSNLLSKKKLGIDFADRIASIYDTTPDGLVWLFLRGGEGAVRVGNIQGWQKAVDEARGTMPDLPYELAAEVVMPSWPTSRRATAAFAQDLALVFSKHAAITQTRIRAQKTAP